VAQMTKTEREVLGHLVRERARLGKTMAEQRSAEMLADAEANLSAIYDIDHEAWRDLTATAAAAVRKADEQVARRCREMGIPERFRPSLEVRWYERGENAHKERRAELRLAIKAKIAALQAQAVTRIDLAKVEELTLLAQDGLETEAAQSFLAAMPTPAALMPPLDVEEIKAIAMDKAA
jgi:hypothetical protein